MPLQVKDSGPTSFPKPDFLTLQNFKRGVITLINDSRLPKNALKEAKNLFLYEDGQPGPRPGVNWYGTAPDSNHQIDGFDYFDANGTIHLIALSNGTVYRSLDNGSSWNACSGATLTAGIWTNMNQNGSFLYQTNGTDNIIRYDGSTTLQVYTSLATPSAPTVGKTGLASTTKTYWYKTSQVNTVGYSVASGATSIQVTSSRDLWDSTANFVTISGTVSTSATRVDVYLSEDNINFYYLDSTVVDSGTGNYSYNDTGTAQVVPSTLAPTANTTQGEKYKELTNIGIRQWGVRNTTVRERIGWTGSGNNSGSFSTAYDGGYLDWQPGGKLYPMKAVDYRTGKGDSIATVYMNSADGKGGIVQLSLDQLTIDTFTITVPNAFALPGSRGTPAPNSVINVLNDYMFYNSQAFYNLGTRAQFLNILSTDEASSNIRPNVKQINRAYEGDICSEYFDANVYFSYPSAGSTTNNKTAIYNTEMKAWLPEAFTIGFKKFLRYTDTNGQQHLLCLKPGDARLSEISTDFNGDYGVSFETSLTTGLYSTLKDRFEFQFTEEGEFELANTGGNITIELLGIDRVRGYRSIKTVLLESTSTTNTTGWDTFAWDAMAWDDTSNSPAVIAEPSIPRYFTVQKELRAVQWHIFTNATDARYILRTFQTWGTASQAGHPPSWRLNPI